MAGYWSRLRAKPNLAIGALGAVLSCLGAVFGLLTVLAHFLPAWVPVVVSGMALVLLIPITRQLLTRPAIRGPRDTDLKPELREYLVGNILHPHLSPVCHHPAVDQATGEGLACAVALIAYRGLARVYNLAVRMTHDLRREDKFTKASLLRHYRFVSKILHRLTGMNSTWATKAILRFRSDETQALFDFMMKAEDQIKRHALRPLEELLRKAPAAMGWDQYDPAYSPHIEQALTITVPQAIEELWAHDNGWAAVGRGIDRLRQRLVDKWHTCVLSAWSDDLCRPIRKTAQDARNRTIVDVA